MYECKIGIDRCLTKPTCQKEGTNCKQVGTELTDKCCGRKIPAQFVFNLCFSQICLSAEKMKTYVLQNQLARYMERNVNRTARSQLTSVVVGIIQKNLFLSFASLRYVRVQNRY